MPPVDTIRRDEVNAVLANQRELVSAARDIKNFVADVHNKVKVFDSEVNACCYLISIVRRTQPITIGQL